MLKQVRLMAIVLAVVATVELNSARGGLITNGGFETGDFTGWTLSGNTSDPTTYGVDSSFPYAGTYNAYFGPQGSQAFLSQTITTTPGQTYELEFFLKNENGASPNEFSVNFGSTSLYDATNLSTFDYQQYVYHVTATSTTTAVTLGFQNDFSYFDVDNISVSPVPEPSSFICFSLGAILLGYHGWRQRFARRNT
ncbi:MAG: carbohydrate binding domain-containing protein [Schlesneria sp.]